MRTRVLRRPIVLLRVRCNILIVFFNKKCSLWQRSLKHTPLYQLLRIKFQKFSGESIFIISHVRHVGTSWLGSEPRQEGRPLLAWCLYQDSRKTFSALSLTNCMESSLFRKAYSSPQTVKKFPTIYGTRRFVSLSVQNDTLHHTLHLDNIHLDHTSRHIPGCWYVLSPNRKETSYSDQTLTCASH